MTHGGRHHGPWPTWRARSRWQRSEPVGQRGQFSDSSVVFPNHRSSKSSQHHIVPNTRAFHGPQNFAITAAVRHGNRKFADSGCTHHLDGLMWRWCRRWVMGGRLRFGRHWKFFAGLGTLVPPEQTCGQPGEIILRSSHSGGPEGPHLPQACRS